MTPMSKMFLTVLLPTSCLVGSIFLLSTCQDESQAPKTPFSADATGLSGTWSSGCLKDSGKSGSFFLDNRSFENGSFRTEFFSFSDNSCTTSVMTQKQAGSYVLGNPEDGQTARPIDLTVGTVLITLHTESLIKSYNERSFCGGNWQLNVEREITRELCVPENSGNSEPDVIYEIFEIIDNAIYFGAKDVHHNGRSESNRPIALDDSRGYVKS